MDGLAVFTLVGKLSDKKLVSYGSAGKSLIRFRCGGVPVCAFSAWLEGQIDKAIALEKDCSVYGSVSVRSTKDGSEFLSLVADSVVWRFTKD